MREPLLNDEAYRPPHRTDPSASYPLLRHASTMVTVGVFSRRSSIRHTWRSELSEPCSCYAASCFTYSIVGIHAMLLFTNCPEAIPEWPIHLALPEAALVTLQGCWSFASDVHAVGRESSWHIVDRLMAQLLLSMQFLKFGILLPDAMSTAECVWLWTWLAIGVACKMRGYRGVIDGSMSRYRLWHIAWHCTVPMGVLAFHHYRWYSCLTCGSSG